MNWPKHIDDNESGYDEQFKVDNMFGAKVCAMIDRSIYSFLGSYLSASAPDDINWHVLCQDNKRNDIEANTFIANLPAFLIPRITESIPSDKGESFFGDSRKRLKMSDQSIIKNTKPLAELSISRENYQKWFTHKVVKDTCF